MSAFKAIVLGLGLMATQAAAEQVSFASGWSVQKLSFFSNNEYRFGSQLEMRSDAAVSIAYTRLPQSLWSAQTASWEWAVTQSVPATNLRVKGGDDRNFAIYFVFLPQAAALESQGAGIRSLLGEKDVRVLLYAWGGNEPRGTRIASPYLPGQGLNVLLRPAGTGAFRERVDLAGDYQQAFGTAPGALVGIAVSGDSDDTNSAIRATLRNLQLQ
jgi:hypothetical protein